jgi:hypothetical protein
LDLASALRISGRQGSERQIRSASAIMISLRDNKASLR